MGKQAYHPRLAMAGTIGAAHVGERRVEELARQSWLAMAENFLVDADARIVKYLQVATTNYQGGYHRCRFWTSTWSTGCRVSTGGSHPVDGRTRGQYSKESWYEFAQQCTLEP